MKLNHVCYTNTTNGYGREEMIDSVTEIQTEPIDVSGATETVQGNYNLVLPNGVNSNTTTVRVKVEIQKKVLNG